MGQTSKFAASSLIVQRAASIIHYNLELGAVIIELRCGRSLHPYLPDSRFIGGHNL